MERACERMGQGRFADARNVLYQQVPPRHQGYDGEPNRFGLALDDSLHRALQAFNPFDRVGAGYLSTTDGFEVPHARVCILHARCPLKWFAFYIVSARQARKSWPPLECDLRALLVVD